jgi:hypothetical protein
MATLVFTPVDNSDIILFLRALKPQKLTVTEDLKGHDKLEFTDGTVVLTSKKAVLLALTSLAAESSKLLGSSASEKILVSTRAF